MVIRNERRVLLVFDAKEAKMLRMDCILQTNVKEEVEPSLGTSDSCQYEIESREEAQFMQEVKDEFEIKVEDEFLGFSDEPFFPNQQESPDKQDTIRTREEGQFMQEVKEEFEIKVEDEVMGLPDEPFFPNQQESTGKQDTIRTRPHHSGSAVMASQGMREVEMSLVEAVRDHPTLQDSQNEKHKLRRHHKSQFISVGESMNSLDPQLGMFTAVLERHCGVKIMASPLDKEELDLLAAAAVAATLLQKTKKRRKRRVWTKEWLLKRDGLSHLKLLEELRLEPVDWLNYLRMDEQTYLTLLSLVSPFIKKQDMYAQGHITS
ncbi:uncharacterized protein LOC123518147 isoform X3 [Portunus trituberculatus]|uniref:uncharacterized protein LOC123518147 isoform X3 n=1 Tax=Portunus trituberculatus TaxID=210409 RepID=UPI001E1D0FE5|nr:uncharacterized protein LOC123518147 isoform X3 [Portunus trituberculatus]